MNYHGDLFEVLPTLGAASIDSCVTDPPYELAFMGKRWDASGVAFQSETWEAIRRVLKPGAHLVAFGGTRTSHRMVCAIEDAGFEIRDSLIWIYGSGFPKSRNLGEGWGTALKPGHEPIALARKPFKGSITANHQQYGVGGLNVDGCRIEAADGDYDHPGNDRKARSTFGYGWKQNNQQPPSDLGRWPANCILSHHPDCGVLDVWEHELSRCDSSVADAEHGAKQRTSATRGDTAPNNAVPMPSAKANRRRRAIDKTDIGCSDGLFPEAPSDDRSDDLSSSTSISGRRPTGLFQPDSSSTTRIATDSTTPSIISSSSHAVNIAPSTKPSAPTGSGRWHCVPACPVRMLDEQSGETESSASLRGLAGRHDAGDQSNQRLKPYTNSLRGHDDTGGASRFFYVAKPSREERDYGCEGLSKQFLATMGDGIGEREHNRDQPSAYVRNHHPTVKPIALMRWLVRLVTPVNGTVLDPFMGSGTTGMACRYELRNFVGIEREAEYLAIAERRIAAVCPLFGEATA